MKKEVCMRYEEEKELECMVELKGNELRRDYQKEGLNVEREYENELLKKKKGELIGGMWRGLKEYLNVGGYRGIEKVDQEGTKEFLRMIGFKDLKGDEIEDKGSWNIGGLVEE